MLRYGSMPCCVFLSYASMLCHSMLYYVVCSMLCCYIPILCYVSTLCCDAVMSFTLNTDIMLLCCVMLFYVLSPCCYASRLRFYFMLCAYASSGYVLFPCYVSMLYYVMLEIYAMSLCCVMLCICHRLCCSWTAMCVCDLLLCFYVIFLRFYILFLCHVMPLCYFMLYDVILLCCFVRLLCYAMFLRDVPSLCYVTVLCFVVMFLRYVFMVC